MGFVKLHDTILGSTVWAYPPDVVKIWITLLVLCDSEGVVSSRAPGIAHMARLTLEQTEAALKIFREPDHYSTTQENEGRRIVESEQGWSILNYKKYRAKLSAESEKQRKRDWARKNREQNGVDAKRPHVDANSESSTQDKTRQNKTKQEEKREDKYEIVLDESTIPRGPSNQQPQPDSTTQQIKNLIRQHWPSYSEDKAEATAMMLRTKSGGLNLPELFSKAIFKWAPDRDANHKTHGLHTYLANWFANAQEPHTAPNAKGVPETTASPEKRMRGRIRHMRYCIRVNDPVSVAEVYQLALADENAGKLWHDLCEAGNKKYLESDAKFRASELRKPIEEMDGNQAAMIGELVKGIGG